MNEQYNQHGSFSWCELMTNNAQEAKAFYEQLFGWETEDIILPDMAYSLIKKDGKEIGGGIVEMPDRPAMWSAYVTVNDVDETVQLAKQLGAAVLLPPQDIPNVGRISVIQDPQGASINLIAYLNRCCESQGTDQVSGVR